jgi:hypothetical protein
MDDSPLTNEETSEFPFHLDDDAFDASIAFLESSEVVAADTGEVDEEGTSTKYLEAQDENLAALD